MFEGLVRGGLQFSYTLVHSEPEMVLEVNVYECDSRISSGSHTSRFWHWTGCLDVRCEIQRPLC
jgi:hypothetical protein